ncbi:MAG: 50S ribosomal protein L22 [Fimbriimonadales bacterium]|jgi:large subunit ribosomal protein L22|nr:50S ribosomal protein L22 [Armatimonadota bacterium]MCX7687755.1 50S ribosomal protein L22 [Fimbriimonadales bacterium]CUU11057.1 LSU ribosomal protein L22P [Armatimonadetes bacterium GBS]CUU37680.1 LSU ribosomal protein L22P [Armatimonadetes bacterium DC]CUU38864.1 LSU ribosomal protein L22P [Armatimonadetes bacterium GXS]GBC90623.1 50S ribosomal protein L22 [bacterium HR14]
MKAVARYVRIPPRKARLAVDLVRGKSTDEALTLLAQLPNKSARVVSKVIESAVANAVHNFNLDPRWLYVERAFVDEGPRWKRILPKDRGRAFRILKRTSHITVILGLKQPRTQASRRPASQEEAN